MIYLVSPPNASGRRSLVLAGVHNWPGRSSCLPRSRFPAVAPSGVPIPGFGISSVPLLEDPNSLKRNQQ